MSDGFVFTADDTRPRLSVSLGGAEVVRLDFALPEPSDTLVVRLDQRGDGEGWRVGVRVDNLVEAPVTLPPVGVALSVAEGWVGWTWTSDPEGFVVVAPARCGGPVLLVRARGFARVDPTPVFDTVDAVPDPALPRAYEVLHLAQPTGALRGHGRTQTTLEFDAVDDPADAAALLPAWLPELVVDAEDELVFDTPDQAVVPGPGARVSTLDTSAVVSGRPGHREVAIHATRGVHRLRATFAPAATDAWLGDLVAGWLRRRPGSMRSGRGLIAAIALERGVVGDAERLQDWLESVDWLTRQDAFGVATAATLATRSADADLARGAWAAALALASGRGRALAGLRAWLACLSAAGEAGELGLLGPGSVPDSALEAALEAALVTQSDAPEWADALTGVLRRLGGELPGQPLGLRADEAGYLVALLRLVPETWPLRTAATATARKAAGLLIGDVVGGHHPGHDGLAWLLLGESLSGGR